jgi:23S rRNA (guanosine2251-2'-O)-methyltransferase
MPGNSQRRGATRKTSKARPTAGSGGRVRRGLEGKGPTPKAKDREGHVRHKQAKLAARSHAKQSGRSSSTSRGRTTRGDRGSEWVAGRNSVVEALRATLPVTTVYIAQRTERDDRVREALKLVADRGLSVLEVSRAELDRLTGEAVHQGIALKVPPYEYAHPDDLVKRAHERSEVPLLVALDSVTDPRNLGAVVRSAAAFGAHGVVVPERRAAGMTASAWKTSAGAAVRLPVARATNLTRQLKSFQRAGLMVAGLDAAGDRDVADLDLSADPLVLVVGSEGTGLSRLVREQCDVLVRIPMQADSESLNAGVAAGIALYEIARGR